MHLLGRDLSKKKAQMKKVKKKKGIMRVIATRGVMFRPVSMLPIPSAAISKLRENGYYYLEDVVSEKGLSREARDILKPWGLHQHECWLKLTTAPTARSAMDLWQEEIFQGRIATFSKAIDKLLSGGVPMFVLTEFCGSPGSGKTQICLQLCVNVQLPKQIGGLDGEAVFIDTCSGFTVSRIREIAEACQAHCHILRETSKEVVEELTKINSESLLNGIHVISIHGYVQLMATVLSLRGFLEQHSRVRLIVVDSLSFPFVGTITNNYLQRIALLYRVLNELQGLSHKFKLAVVVTNQLTTQLTVGDNGQIAGLVPALGETFSQRINQRILLGDMASIRTATTVKECVRPDITTVPFVWSAEDESGFCARSAQLAADGNSMLCGCFVAHHSRFLLFCRTDKSVWNPGLLAALNKGPMSSNGIKHREYFYQLLLSH